MNGIFMGILGGAVAGGAMAFGALSTILQPQKMSLEFNSMEKIFNFVLCGFFLAASFSYINPTLEKNFHGGLTHNYELWSVIAGATAGLLLMLLFIEIVRERVARESRNHESIEKILFLMMHNFPAGMIAGVAMGIHHPGISYSLLCFIGVHQLFLGTLGARNLLSMGLESELSFVGSLFISSIAVISAILGTVLSQKYVSLLPVMLAFAGGCYVGIPVNEWIEKMKKGQRKIELNPGLFSGMIVTLIFIIWKEFV